MGFVVGVAVVLLAMADYSRPRSVLQFGVLFWIFVLAMVELLPVPVSRVLHLSLGLPIRLAVAILYAPFVAGTVALLGSFDSRELRRDITPFKSAFNRSQAALATLAAGEALRLFSGHPPQAGLYVLIPAALVATVFNYVVNISLVSVAMRLLYKRAIGDVLGQLRIGRVSEFLLSYLGLGFVGVILAALYQRVGSLGVCGCVLPLVFARQMFFRTMALEEAGKQLENRGRVLRALSNRMAEERQDERMQIAGYLHDDLAQMLFRLTLQAEMAKKRLARGDIEAVNRDLEGIISTKQQTSDMVRALIRDLHRSPIGRNGLAEAIQSFAEDMTKGLQTRIETHVVEVSLPPPIQLLIYQIAREAAMNALKHAEADTIWITLQEKDDGVELQIRDDGKGFDTSAPPPEGHFGSVMMKERAQVTGGTFSIESEPGSGTTITATFPRVWLEEGTLLESESETSPTRVGRPSGDGLLNLPAAQEDQESGRSGSFPATGVAQPESIRTPPTRREALVGLLRRRSA